ncbi:MAG: hypothetical protein CMK59_02120 [Proteobacteria bacterium]|nr:hypothetical protein [Pseudomonadota bacterium]
MIAIHGAGGKLGHLICLEAQKKQIETLSLFRESDLSTAFQSSVEGVIDVSSAAGLKRLLQHLPPKIPLLVGTTGELPWTDLEKHALTAPTAVVSNFSVGIPLLLDLISSAVKMLPEGWDIEIVEAHHNQKIDAPSGTAKRIVHAIKSAQTAKDQIKNIPTHSLRAGDTFGEHTVWLCGPGERLELKHVATQRSVFAIGALRWVCWLQEQDIGLFKP